MTASDLIPEILLQCFRRVPINPFYVNMVIGRLRSDDIYNQVKFNFER